jgi:monovalent cation:H+ antiporter-2, CPA2 family
MTPLLLKDILIIFAVSIPVVLLLKRIHMPMVVGFLITGALIGSHGIGLITETAHVDVLAELGLALLLFTVGLEFSLDSFAFIRKRAITVAITQVLVTCALGWAIGYLMGWPLNRSLYFGCVIALSSSAIVMSIIHDQRMLDSMSGKLTTTVLIVQDLAFIPMIVLLPLVAFDHATAENSLLYTISAKATAVLILTAIVVFGRMIINQLMRHITTLGQRQLFVIAVLIIGLGTSWLTAHMGLSFALGAFVGGILIGSTDYKHQALSEVAPFRYCFNSLFFVSIGMLLNLAFVRDNLPLIFLVLILIPALKLITIVLISLMTRFPLRVGIVTGLSLAQIGEFSFLIAHHGFQVGVIGDYLHNLIIAAAVFNMMITPFLILNAHKVAQYINEQLLKTNKFTKLASNDKKMTSGISRKLKDHVIICGFGPLGETLANFLKKHKVSYAVLELNPKTIQKIKKKEVVAVFGDGTSEDVLYSLKIEKAKLLAITVPYYLDNMAIIKQAKTMNPDIQIITRAKYRSDVDKLYSAGADVVISEELEGGIEMGRYALKMVGLPLEDVDELVNQVREYGSADFFN